MAEQKLRPLRIALIVKNSPAAYARDDRPMGYFSYTVPEFTWEHFTPGKAFRLNTRDLAKQGFDVVIHEDGGNWGEYTGGALPIVYLVIDSTLSYEHHYLPRLEQARRADLILVDHDALDNFQNAGRPVVRWSYCVNDKVFKCAGEKTHDIAYHCNGTDNERARYRVLLHDLSQRHGWTYRSGALPLGEYADSLAKARVVVNQPRVPGNRPHRILDAMACGSCVLTGVIPDVSGEMLAAGIHYETFLGPETLADQLSWLLDSNHWELTARLGHRYVSMYHTWAVRAAELRQILTHWVGV